MTNKQNGNGPADEVDTPGSRKIGSDASQSPMVGGFDFVKRALLVITALMTLTAVGIEVASVVGTRSVDLADILLMFLYTEVIAMIAVFYTDRGSPFIYPILIAITALARLIVLQGKDMAPQNILYEAGSILLLAIAIVVLIRHPIRVSDSSD